VLPKYGTESIAQLPHHIKYLHDLESASTLSFERNKSKITKTILFIVDGLGYEQWLNNEVLNPLMKQISTKGRLRPITSMFPSSTPPSLAGFYTGLTTQEHGLLDWWMYEHKSDQIITTLPFTPFRGGERDSLLSQIPSTTLLSDEVMFHDLEANNISTYTLVSKEYAFSAFSKLSYKESTVMPHNTITEMFNNLRDLVRKEQSSHINVYWGDIDSAGHVNGPSSKEYATQITVFFKEFERFLKNLDHAKDMGSIKIQIAADHGQIDVDPEQVIWLDDLPELTENLDLSTNKRKLLPWGAQRDIFLKIKDNKVNETINLLSEFLEDRAVIIKSTEALSSGLFGTGTPHQDFLSRIGNLIILPTNNYTIWYRHFNDETFTFKGVHGGLTAREVLVPYTECTLADLVH
jgi:predicted AlkP superfamily pyrophosphatase or phosphodiesterase